LLDDVGELYVSLKISETELDEVREAFSSAEDNDWASSTGEQREARVSWS
jgi:hypothetical protein